VSAARSTPAGTTRLCPHCRAVILDSASVCPACKKYLRFDPGAAARAKPSFSPLRVEGSIRHPGEGGGGGEAWEYSVVMAIRNDRGEEISRQVVGVGALKPGDQRTFTFAVEVFAPAGARVPNTGESKPETKPDTKPARAPSTAR
jgi:hypothetical protein